MYKHLFCTECRALYLIAKGRRSMFGGGFHKEILRPLIQFLRIWCPHAHWIGPCIYHGIILKSVWNLYQQLIFFQIASIGWFSRSFYKNINLYMKNICLAKKNAFTVFYVRFLSLPGVWSVFLQCKIFPAPPSSCICGDGQMVNDSSAMWNQNSVAGKKK